MRSGYRSIALVFLFVAIPVLAQTPTLVSGTITDANGLPYSFAKVSAQLAGIPPNVNATIVVNGIPAAIGGQQNASADANGNFTMNLFCNTAGGGCSVISPGGTQWLLTVNETGLPLPVGTGPQTCTAAVTISGASQSISANFAACPALSRLITSLPSLSITGLTPGNCVQAAAGGQLVTIGGPCGSSAGFVTTTGTPAIGNLSCFSAATSITNCNLSGDITTAGGTAATLATVATPGTNTKITYNAKGLVTAGAQAQLASADYANQGTTTTVLHGNAAGNPSFAQVVSGDLNITPTSCVNQFVTAIAANGVGTCGTATLASAQFANQGTVHTVLHGNAAGNPAFGAVDLTSEVANTLPAAQMSQVNLAASGNGGVGGTLPGANMSQVNLAASGNGGVGGTLPSANLGASTSNCAGNNFAQGWNSGGTPICAAPTSGLPSVVYNTASASTNGSIVATTMATAGGGGNTYRFSYYADVTAASGGCTTPATLIVNLIYTDPNVAGTTTQATAGVEHSATLSTLFDIGDSSGNATVGQPIPNNTGGGTATNGTFSYTVRAKAGTAVQYSASHANGSTCAPQASYQIYPVLEQLQ